MTDNEIMQALKSEIRIAEYVDNDFADNVSIALLKDTLDLINRQQAEINKLNAECGHHLEPYELLPHLILPEECPNCGAKMDKE